jgi:F-type H+-transporting ATPase subunit b
VFNEIFEHLKRKIFALKFVNEELAKIKKNLFNPSGGLTRMVSLAEGFGFNTNILETNILNLAVVLAVVFSLGKDVLTSILENRREKIITSLRSADDRFKQAQLELDTAKSEYSLATEKVKEIKAEGVKSVEFINQEGTTRCEEAVQRFKDLQAETIRVEEDKATRELRQQIISIAFTEATEEIKRRMTPILQKKYMDAKISIMVLEL